MDQDDTKLAIDPDLRDRLAALADRSRTSIDDLVNAVLRAHADEQERAIDELAEDEERWQRYLAKGQAVSFETVRGKLLSLAGDAARRAEGR